MSRWSFKDFIRASSNRNLKAARTGCLECAAGIYYLDDAHGEILLAVCNIFR